jgi:hypothetical protein
MAAPIYSQAQVDRMIRTSKFVEQDAWQNRSDGRQSTIEQRDRIKAAPKDDTNLTEFWIESCRCPGRCEASFTLIGKLLEYPEHPLCRYDFQISKHTNPKWFSPYVIGPRVPHRHVYNEKAIREGWTWDKCAEPIHQKKRTYSLEQAINLLAPIFLNDLRIEIYDPDTIGALFGGR